MALNLLGFSFTLGALAAPLLMSTLGAKLGMATVLHILAAGTGLILFPVLMFRFPVATFAGTRLGELLLVLNNPLVWLFGLLLFFESGSENSMFVWVGKIVASVFHSTPQRAGWALAGLSAAIGIGRLGTTFLLRHLGSRRTMLLSTVVTVTSTMIALTSREFLMAVLGMVLIAWALPPSTPLRWGLRATAFRGRRAPCLAPSVRFRWWVERPGRASAARWRQPGCAAFCGCRLLRLQPWQC